MRCSFALFSGLSSDSTVPAGSLANAASVGANTVNGPAPFSVSTSPAAVSALASVLERTGGDRRVDDVLGVLLRRGHPRGGHGDHQGHESSDSESLQHCLVHDFLLNGGPGMIPAARSIECNANNFSHK